MKANILRRASLGASCVALLAACGDAAPEGPQTYALESVNGQPLPFTHNAVAVTDSTCQPTVVRGSLVLEEPPAEAYDARYELRRACMVEGIVNTETYDDSASGRFEREETLIHFYGPSALSADSAAPAAGATDPIMQGTELGDTLSLFHHGIGLTLRFVRATTGG